MKKVMGFVFGLLMAFVPLLGGNVRAEAPNGERAVVYSALLESMRKVLFKGKQLSRMKRVQKEYGSWSARPFSEARKRFAADLQARLKADEPEIVMNHQIFASYAFEKFDNLKVPCFYLRMVFDGYKNMEHDVVLLPQGDGYFGNYWYICDFYRAIDKKNEKYLFMPLMEYIDEMNCINLDSLVGLAIVDKGSTRPMHGNMGDYHDLRVWLYGLPKDVNHTAAENIAEWERVRRRNRLGAMMRFETPGMNLRLMSGEDYYQVDFRLLCTLYESVGMPPELMVQMAETEGAKESGAAKSSAAKE